MREWAVTAYGLALAACFSPDPPGGVPCGPDGTCPDGQSCNIITQICDGANPDDPAARSWLDNSAADFMQGTYLDEVTIEPGGFVGPVGSFTGGVRVSGIAGAKVTAATTFEDLAVMPRVGSGISRTVQIDYGLESPVGAGFQLTDIDNVTVLVEGEIQLDVAGSWKFDLFADDLGFVDIAPPGSTTFARLIQDASNGTQGTLQVPTPGWYKIRGAFSDTGGGMSWRFRVDSPAVPGGVRVVDADALRVRNDDVGGIAIDGFDQAFCIDYRGTTLVDSLDQTYGTAPFGLDIGIGAYTVRSSGQLLIDVDGDYAFTIDSIQGHRAWIDGVSVADVMSSTAQITTTSPIRLAPGWHDLIVDVQKNGGSGIPKLDFTIASGPVTGPIPTDHLRPILGRSQRFATARSTTVTAIPDAGSAIRTLNISANSLTADRIDVALEITHPVPAQLDALLDPPAGGTIVLYAAGDLAGGPIKYVADTAPAGDAGNSWQFTVTDHLLDMITGSVTFVGVTMLGRGGVAPFATTYHYESAVHELGAVVSFGPLAWRLRQGDQTAAMVKLRTCDDAAACTAEPYIVVPFNTVPANPVRRFAQYSIDITTDGDVPTALDAVELKYSIQP